MLGRRGEVQIGIRIALFFAVFRESEFLQKKSHTKTCDEEIIGKSALPMMMSVRIVRRLVLRCIEMVIEFFRGLRKQVN